MVVDLRQRIFAHPPGDYTLRTLDLSKKGWLNDLPTDRPTFVIAEGLLYYLEPHIVQRMFCDLVEYFPSGQIAFDKLGKLSISLTSRVEFLKSSKSVFKWGVDEPKTIENFHSKLTLKDCVNKKEYMVYAQPLPRYQCTMTDTRFSSGRLHSNLRENELVGFSAPSRQIQRAIFAISVLKGLEHF